MPALEGALAVAAAAAAVLLLAAAARLAAERARFTVSQAVPRESRVDGFRYRVHEAHEDPQGAADTLARLNGRTVALLRRLRARYLRGPEGARHPARRRAAERLLARYSPDSLAENSPRDPSGDTSYCQDKGAVVALCLRQRDGGRHGMHDLDTLTFVTLHEMAHIATEETGHPAAFWSGFRFLLEEAEAGGIYRSPDYARRPARYCGVTVDYNPRLDPQVPSLA